MTYKWEDLPSRKNLFTVKNTVMMDLDKQKPIQHYSTNTKIAVVQKYIAPDKTYYRTQDAALNNLNYAFEAEAFGLPNEKAPLAPSKSISLSNQVNSKHTTRSQEKKQTAVQKVATPKNGEAGRLKNWLNKFFRRKNG